MSSCLAIAYMRGLILEGLVFMRDAWYWIKLFAPWFVIAWILLVQAYQMVWEAHQCPT